MQERPMKPTVEVDANPLRRADRWKRAALALVVALLVATGVWLAFRGASGRNAQSTSVVDTAAPSRGSFSQGRKITPASETAKDKVRPDPGAKEEAARAAAARVAAEQDAENVAAQQSAQADQLAVKQRELEQQQAAQEAQAKKIAGDNARLEKEKANVHEAKLEADKAAEKANAGTKAHPAYNGPPSGTLVWQGEVKGVTLVTITGSQSDEGRLVSGALPGVLVLVQPNDSKHVMVASAPSPSNGYQRLTLRVQGNGTVQQSIRWSLP
jgi:type IV secretory pathway VirB10-like protein